MTLSTKSTMQSKRRTQRKPGEKIGAGTSLRVIVMVAVGAIFALPILGFVAMSFRNNDHVSAGKDGFLGLGGMSIHNAINSFHTINAFGPGKGGLFTQWIMNSVLLSIVACVLGVFSSLPAGYALARLRFKGKKTVLFLTLLAMTMPNTVLVVPIFLEVDKINSVGQLWPVMVLLGFFPFGTYLSYIHFMTTLPHELIEAARLDGLGDIETFIKVALPIAKQAIALVSFYNIIATWTNFFLPLALLSASQNHQTITLGLQQLIGASPLFNPTIAAGLTVKLYMPQLALATFLSTLPLLAIFIFAQRYLLRGQTLGAVKG